MYLVNQKRTQIIKFKSRIKIKKILTKEMVEDSNRYRKDLISSIVRDRDKLPQLTTLVDPELIFFGGVTAQDSEEVSKMVNQYIKDKYGENGIKYRIVLNTGKIILAEYPDLASVTKEMNRLVEAISRGDNIFEFKEV